MDLFSNFHGLDVSPEWLMSIFNRVKMLSHSPRHNRQTRVRETKYTVVIPQIEFV
jgi:hypothetical protein